MAASIIQFPSTAASAARTDIRSIRSPEIAREANLRAAAIIERAIREIGDERPSHLCFDVPCAIEVLRDAAQSLLGATPFVGSGGAV